MYTCTRTRVCVRVHTYVGPLAKLKESFFKCFNILNMLRIKNNIDINQLRAQQREREREEREVPSAQGTTHSHTHTHAEFTVYYTV